MRRDNSNLIRTRELVKITGQTQTTIKYYLDLGLIPHIVHQNEKRISRFFEPEQAVNRVKFILKLKKKRYYIREIIEECQKLDALGGGQ